MTSRSRESLKSYFRAGALPTENHFADLIDSTLNMNDEGFRKTVEHGMEIYAPIGHEALLSFYRDQLPEQPLWEMGFSASDQLQIQHSSNAQRTNTAVTLLNLDPRQRVGISIDDPQTALDIDGCVRSTGRQGSYPVEPVLANGKWQDLVKDLEGCQAFEIVAGAGHPGQGRFGLLHAVALNTYNPTLGIFNFFNRKRGIRCTHSYYSGRCDRLQLRWIGTSGRNAKYSLQIRTGCDYGSIDQQTCGIQVHVNQLWFNPAMQAGKAG